MSGLLQRLKQRKLVQWGIAYVAFAFALLQGVDIIAQRFAWPEAVERGLIVVLAIGFFIALVLAWYHGERGAQRVSGTELVILALLLAIGGGVLWRFTRAPAAAPATAGAQAATTPAPVATVAADARSIAVLPFSNTSGQQDQQFFSDGLSEDLITALSQFQGLKVISRNSAFQFRDSKDTSARIGTLLGVAHLLEGSVQRAGDRVRITATLVNAADGTVLWTQRYDKPYADLFALQDAITQAVASELKTKLLTGAGAATQGERPPSGNLAAYNNLLQGRFYAQRQTRADMEKGIGYLTSATRLDPDYALAWGWLAKAEAELAGNYLGGAEAAQGWDKARAAVDKSLALDPNLDMAHSVNAFILNSADRDWVRAEAEAQRAYQLAPGKRFSSLASTRALLGQARQAVELLQRGLPNDPLCSPCYDLLARLLPALGQLDEAAQAARKALQLSPQRYFTRVQLVFVEAMRGNAAQALEEARQLPPGQWHDMAMAVALQVGSDRAAADKALQVMIAGQAGSAAYQIAEIYALRRDPDNMFKWLDRASENRDPGIQMLLTDALILRYRDDPRFAAFCRKLGLSTTTDAKALP